MATYGCLDLSFPLNAWSQYQSLFGNNIHEGNKEVREDKIITRKEKGTIEDGRMEGTFTFCLLYHMQSYFQRCAQVSSIFFQSMNTSDRNEWAFERNVGFTNILLFDFSTNKILMQKTCVSHNIFRFLCERLGSYLERKNTCMKEAISKSLQRFRIENVQCTVGEIYRVVENIIS